MTNPKPKTEATREPVQPPAVGALLERGVGRLEPEREEDAISRSRRILEMVDTYCARPDSMNRTALRVGLMGEFEDARAQGRNDFGLADMHILRAALADYAANKNVLEARRSRARLMWQVLRME
jgi:hypothetical protein